MDRGRGPAHPDAVTPIAQAIRRAIKEAGHTQASIGELLGEEQNTISDWLRRKCFPLELIARFEDVLGRRRGDFLVEVGAVELPATTVEMIEMDPSLSPSDRGALLLAYQALVDREDR